MDDRLKRKIRECGIIPVFSGLSPQKTANLAKKLSSWGITAVEITFRADDAQKAIEETRLLCPELLIAAGTVLSPETAQRAQAAGADFAVSPGFSANTVVACEKIGLPIIPGCVTPTEIELAMQYGIDVVKFFPAEQFGGIKTINALSAPYQSICFMPTGGINLDNLSKYMACDRVLACGGSFMIGDNEEQCRANTQKACSIIKMTRTRE